jgi:peptidoglycan/xylan/chitin deacetylase (PgdA/CDA1 family)
MKWIVALALQACGVLAMLEWRHAKAIRILLFHRVAETPVNDGMTVSLEAFRGQLSYLAERYRFVSLDEVSNMINDQEPLMPGGIVVTFDDGYQDNYTLARPALISHAIPATIFVATGAVDGSIPIWTQELREAVLGGSRRVVDLRPFGWELWRLDTDQDRQRCLESLRNRLKAMPEDQREQTATAVLHELGWSKEALSNARSFSTLMMTWEMVRGWQKDGLTVGAHTVSHKILTRISEEAAEWEIVESKRYIEAQVGQPVRHFAYPNGTSRDWSSIIQNLVRRAGFQSACTTVYGTNALGDDLYALRRIEIQDKGCMDPFGRFSPALFIASLTGVFRVFGRLKSSC